MDTTEMLRRKAFDNSIDALRLYTTFPQNVFRESWAAFFFLESYMVFYSGFIAALYSLMDAEGSQSCCLINLGGGGTQQCYDNPPAIYLCKSIEPSQYMSLLRRGGANSWSVLMDRYVCASDVGEWCIYCEKQNDVAVIAFRSEIGANKFAVPLEGLQATSIQFASQTPREGAFRFDKLTPAWRSSLVAQYSR
jgi:hypothetical protein